jgi:hypothetical protein
MRPSVHGARSRIAARSGAARLSPPVPTISSTPGPASTAMQLLRMARAKPAISAGVSPLARSSTRKAAVCAASDAFSSVCEVPHRRLVHQLTAHAAGARVLLRRTPSACSTRSSVRFWRAISVSMTCGDARDVNTVWTLHTRHLCPAARARTSRRSSPAEAPATVGGRPRGACERRGAGCRRACGTAARQRMRAGRQTTAARCSPQKRSQMRACAAAGAQARATAHRRSAKGSSGRSARYGVANPQAPQRLQRRLRRRTQHPAGGRRCEPLPRAGR